MNLMSFNCGLNNAKISASALIIVNEKLKAAVSVQYFAIAPKVVPVKDSRASVKDGLHFSQRSWHIIRGKVVLTVQIHKREVVKFWRKIHMALQPLKKDPNILITKADKSNITTVLDKQWYDNKTNKMSDDQDTYKHFKTNTTASTTKDVHKFVKNLLETNKITKEASFRLKNSDSATNRLYRLPKLQKENNIPYDQYKFFTDSPIHQRIS